MPRDDTYTMMMTLAERGLGKSFGGEGSQEARSVGLILSAIDQLATAQQMDSSMFQSIQAAIDMLREGIEGRVPKEQPPPDEEEPPQPKDENSKEEPPPPTKKGEKKEPPSQINDSSRREENDNIRK